MKNQKNLIFVTIFVSVASLFMAGFALLTSHQAKNLALSDISIEEKNSFSTPVFDQNTGKNSYLTIYELAISNLGGPDVELVRLSKVQEGAGYLVPLKDQQIMNQDIEAISFLVEPTISTLMQEPKRLREITKEDMGPAADLSVVIKNGETKTLRFGISLQPYDDQNNPVAQVVLVSFRLEFNNGKNYIFRRGFPIKPLKTMSAAN